MIPNAQEGMCANQEASNKDGWSFEVWKKKKVEQKTEAILLLDWTWMFQVDEEDVNKLLETEETEGVVPVEQGSEERTDLEDVFRWEICNDALLFLLDGGF